MAERVDCFKGSVCGMLTPKVAPKLGVNAKDDDDCECCVNTGCSLEPARGYACPACGETWPDEDFAEGCCE